MVRNVSLVIVGFAAMWLFTGCAAAQPAAPLPTATALIAQPSDDESVAAPVSIETAPAAPDYTQVASVEGDLYILGNPDAPVLLIDFSDFL